MIIGVYTFSLIGFLSFLGSPFEEISAHINPHLRVQCPGVRPHIITNCSGSGAPSNNNKSSPPILSLLVNQRYFSWIGT